jgi:hypothetical protein
MTTPKNPPAFPTHGNHDIHGQELNPPTVGMTLRDYFAAKAMAALIATLKPEVSDMGYLLPSQWRPVVSGAFKIADEMLTERNRRGA